MHRQNLDRLERLIEFAESFSPTRIEIANVQYYGWALENRALQMPTREQPERSIGVVAEAQQRLRGRITIDFVLPDYHARFPKACMGGWGQRLLLMDPAGDVLPCHAAKVLPEMRFENVRSTPLRDIWQSSEAFQRFRGEEWMAEPCRGCERRTLDHGGCRCQAFLLAGRAEATDPACSLPPRSRAGYLQTARAWSAGAVGLRSWRNIEDAILELPHQPSLSGGSGDRSSAITFHQRKQPCDANTMLRSKWSRPLLTVRDIGIDHLRWIDDAIKFVFSNKAELQCCGLQRNVVVHRVVSNL